MTEPERVDRLRRYESGDIALVGVVAVILYSAVTGTLSSFASVLGAAAVPILARRLFERVDLSAAGQRAVFGVAITLGATIAVFTVFPAHSWLAPVAAATGGWIVLDAVYASRVRERDEHTAVKGWSARTALTRASRSRAVVDALETASRPLTAEELQERTALPVDELEATLELVRENGTVERIGTGYVVDERERRTMTIVREIVSGVGGRVLRPFRLFGPSR
ncbi:hypothetical protein [Halomontanus rarus]|uniref:hypothetical protein n=1 Tax=Halomontanus rarus TaxID=3034020 RepID=UPI001A997BCF